MPGPVEATSSTLEVDHEDNVWKLKQRVEAFTLNHPKNHYYSYKFRAPRGGGGLEKDLKFHPKSETMCDKPW